MIVVVGWFDFYGLSGIALSIDSKPPAHFNPLFIGILCLFTQGASVAYSRDFPHRIAYGIGDLECSKNCNPQRGSLGEKLGLAWLSPLPPYIAFPPRWDASPRSLCPETPATIQYSRVPRFLRFTILSHQGMCPRYCPKRWTIPQAKLAIPLATPRGRRFPGM